MKLWTIQPIEVYDLIMDIGTYRCEPEKIDFDCFIPAYDWLSEQMKIKIGPPPTGVKYPAWAWRMWEGKTKPDLRHYRWSCGYEGDRFVCMELDVPDKDVLLSDFDLWHMVLNESLISFSEDEDAELEEHYINLSDTEKKKFKDKNWQEIFNIEYFENDWILRGTSIQATIWEIRREYIKNVKFFTGATKRSNYTQDR